MAKKDNTLWWVLGGLAVVGGGTAIYFATREKEDKVDEKLYTGGHVGPDTLTQPSNGGAPELNIPPDLLAAMAAEFAKKDKFWPWP